MLKLLIPVFLLFWLQQESVWGDNNLNTTTVKPTNKSINDSKLNSASGNNTLVEKKKEARNIEKPRFSGGNIISSSTRNPVNKNISKSCSGWCISVNNKTVAWEDKKATKFINIEHPGKRFSVNTDGKQRDRLKSVRRIVDRFPYYPVRVTMSTFSDRKGYEDNYDNKGMKTKFAQLFNKNLVHVPTDMFFPYTRSAVKQLIDDSGYVYSPSTRLKYTGRRGSEVVPWIPIPTNLVSENDDSKEKFSNVYFEKVPFLYYDQEGNKRKANYIVYPGDILDFSEVNKAIVKSSKDDKRLTKDNKPSNTPTGKPVRMVPPTIPPGINKKFILVNAKEFVSNNQIHRSNYINQDHYSTISRVLGIQDDAAIFNSPSNNIDDIVGAMRITKDAGTLIMGTTKTARTKLSKWLGGKVRSLALDNFNNGILIRNDSTTRSNEISKLLKSMLNNYQYGGSTIPQGRRVTRREFVQDINF
ncbi:hypothetical protein ILUMI_04507 [Ignelater luminosus]|uniref:OmpA-like domain-containing protein n=1 Tax=Ignelater luminosus TaxID=2038154 RepID=A0A8K0GJ01_IGNLU|nr:hypothetical protein ILUMI_04507 [Ignelater luminosus]